MGRDNKECVLSHAVNHLRDLTQVSLSNHQMDLLSLASSVWTLMTQKPRRWRERPLEYICWLQLTTQHVKTQCGVESVGALQVDRTFSFSPLRRTLSTTTQLSHFGGRACAAGRRPRAHRGTGVWPDAASAVRIVFSTCYVRAWTAGPDSPGFHWAAAAPSTWGVLINTASSQNPEKHQAQQEDRPCQMIALNKQSLGCLDASSTLTRPHVSNVHL